jgi:malate synthase
MEDAATAEISRSQLWQWIHNENGVLDDGRKIDVELFRKLLAEEMEVIKQELGPGYDAGRYEEAARLFDEISTADKLVDFLTLPAYTMID